MNSNAIVSEKKFNYKNLFNKLFGKRPSGLSSILGRCYIRGFSSPFTYVPCLTQTKNALCAVKLSRKES